MYFCVIGYNISFISDFIYLNLLSFFLGESSSRFVNFVVLFRELALDFIDLFDCLFSFYFIISVLIFDISSFLLNFGFLCSFFFPSSFRCKVRLFIWDFVVVVVVVSSGRHLLLEISLLELLYLYLIYFDIAYFHFCLSQGIFNFSFKSSFTHWYSVACCLVSTYF